MAIKEFTTAVEQRTEPPEEGTPFLVDGFECRYFQPNETQLALLMAQTSRHSSIPEQVAGIINFFVDVLDDSSHQYIVSRLMDKRDPFGLEEVEGIMAWMVEEWTGRPIQPPSGSTPSRQSGGRNSTRRTSKSTSSASLPIGS